MSKLMVVMEVINNTHIPVGVYDDFATVTALFADGAITNKTHYIAVFEENTLTPADIVNKIAGRFVIENIAKRENADHEYVSWFVPREVENNEDDVEPVQNEV